MHAYSPVILNPSIVSLESCIFGASAFANPSLLCYAMLCYAMLCYVYNLPSSANTWGIHHWKNTNTNRQIRTFWDRYRTWYTCSTYQIRWCDVMWCTILADVLELEFLYTQCHVMYAIFGTAILRLFAKFWSVNRKPYAYRAWRSVHECTRVRGVTQHIIIMRVHTHYKFLPRVARFFWILSSIELVHG